MPPEARQPATSRASISGRSLICRAQVVLSKGITNFKAIDAFVLDVIAHDVAHVGTAPHDAAALKAAGAALKAACADTLRHTTTGASMSSAQHAVMRVLASRPTSV